MPIYEFMCECGHEVEVLAKVDEQVECEKCGEPMVKVFSGSHFDKQKLKVFMRGCPGRPFDGSLPTD